MNIRASLCRASLIATLGIAAAASIPASAQPSENLADYVTYGDRYFIETITQPSLTPGRARAVVAFRLTFDLITFRRDVGGRGGDLYRATPSVYVEAVAADGVISDRGLWRDTITTDSYAETNSKSHWVVGAIALSLRPGVYALKYTIGDDGPNETVAASIPALRVDDFGSISPAIGLPLFLKEVRGDTLTASGIGGGALFGRRFRAYVPLSGIEPGSSVRFDLLERVGEGEEKRNGRVLQSGIARVRSGAMLSSPTASGNELRFQIIERTDAGPVEQRFAGAVIDTRIDDLEQGEYVLLVTARSAGASVTDSVSFMLMWSDQPVALYRPAYAIRALYPIATEAVVDSLLAIPSEAQEVALREFWRDKDPTPATRYNEAMAEYYRRADYSYFNFRSIGQKDGVFTDRGKIYMLNGPPTQISRQMQPDSHPREVWSYENRVARVFVFIDESKTGEYRLVEYHDL